MGTRDGFVRSFACAAMFLVACYEPYDQREDPIAEIARSQPADDAGPDASEMPADRPDASRDVDGASTGAAGPPRCDRTKPFGAPVFIDSIDGADADADARFSADEKTLYFTSDRGTVGAAKRHRVWTATRTGTSFAFSALTLLRDATDGALYDPTVSSDGLTLVVQHTANAGGSELAIATRATTNDAFADLKTLALTEGNLRDPYFAADDALLFTRDGKIARAARSGSTWTSSLVADVGTLANVRNPVEASDGREIFFSSDEGAPGRQHIMRAERASTSLKYGAATAVTELAGTKNYDVPTWLSADGCVILLASDRNGDLDVYYALRGK